MTTPAAPAGRSRSTAVVVIDAVVASLLGGVLVLAGGLAMFFAVMYFSASVDGCGSAGSCAAREQAEFAVLVLCASVLASWTVAGLGTIACALLRRYFWYWSAIGMLIASAGIWWAFRLVIDAGGFR